MDHAHLVSKCRIRQGFRDARHVRQFISELISRVLEDMKLKIAAQLMKDRRSRTAVLTFICNDGAYEA